MKLPSCLSNKGVKRYTDREVIEAKYGPFLEWLTRHGIVTPSTNELRAMLYPMLHEQYRQEVEKQKDDLIASFTRHSEVFKALFALLKESPEKAGLVKSAVEAMREKTDAH